MNPTKCNLKVLASLLFNFYLLMSSKLHLSRLYFYDTCLTFLPCNFFLLPVTATVFENRNFRCGKVLYNICRRNNPYLCSLKNHIRLLTRTSKDGTWNISKDLIYSYFNSKLKLLWIYIKVATKAIFDPSCLINNCREFTVERREGESKVGLQMKHS